MRSPEITIRSYRREDLPAVRRLHFEGLREFGFPVDETSCAWDADLRDIEKTYLKSGGFWVAQAGTQVVGMVGIVRLDDETAELRRMRVHRDWRRRGIASRLCDIAEGFCRERGLARIQLLTEARMEAAGQLYEKRGYRLELADRHGEYASQWYVKELSPLPAPASWQEALRRAARHLALLCGPGEQRRPTIELSDEHIAAFERYLDLLLAWNQKVNLTAITEPTEVAIKHFYDSLTCLAAIEPAAGDEVLDVGSGAGFPGAVLALLRPDLRVTLLDSTRKVTAFLEELVSALALKNVRVVRARAEELARQAEWRGRHHLAVVRAVGSLLQVAKWCRGLLGENGELLLMKGPRGEAELAQARPRLSRLGLALSHVLTLHLPEGAGERRLIVLERR